MWKLDCTKFHLKHMTALHLSLEQGLRSKKKKSSNWYTGGSQIVLFLHPQGTVLLRKPYYLGTNLVLKSQFMTFGFSKSPFLLIFKLFWFLKLNKWLFGFILKHLLSYLSQILTSLQDLRQFLTHKCIHCLIFGYTFSDFCNNHQ